MRSLKCKLTSCEKNQNTECQSEYNKGMRPGWPAGFSLTRKCASEMYCLGWKRDAKRQGKRVLSDAHGRMVVYFWLNLNLSTCRSAKNCFENKIRIWNRQGCAAAVLCPWRLAFIFGWQEKHTQPRSQHLSSYCPIDERPWEQDWNIPSCPAGRPPFWDLTLR